MGREILVIHFGQAGVQMGSAIWELFCIEHRIASNGELMDAGEGQGQSAWENLGSLFYEGQKSWTPRAVMVDLEPTVIDEIRCGAYRQLWKPNCLITGKEDAANNFGRGNCTVGKHKMEETLEAIRKLVEDSNNLAAFELVHSHSGGTGSGFTTLITDQLCDEYGKKFKFGTSIFPSAMYSQSTVDPYNAILHAHSTIDTLDCDILVDNQTLFDRCTKSLSITQPSFSEINRLLAQMLSSLFLSHRFIYHGSQHADTTELLTNLIPYPRIHFPSLFYAPLVPRSQMEHDAMTVQELTRAVFSEEAQTIDFPCKRNAYISCAMLYRGVSSPKQVYDALQVVKSTPSIGATFVDWCPTGFKVGLNSYPPVSFMHSPLAQAPRSVCMLAGNLGMREAWHRNNLKFDVLFSRRCFVHWFIGEGIEESEFIEARDDMAYLEQDYTELMSEAGSPPEPEVPVETNENNPVLNGPVHELDNMNVRLNAKQELQEISSTHIRQSNNANSMQTNSYYHGSRNQRHPLRTTAPMAATTISARYHPEMDSGDYYDSMDHRNVSNRSRGPHVERVTMSNRVETINYADGAQWSTQPYDSAHLENVYSHNDKSYYDDGSASARDSSARFQRARLWPRGDDRVTVTDGHPVISESHDYSSEVTSSNRPRDLNMNYPKHSLAGSDSTFLPTEPIVRQCDTVYSPDDSDRYPSDPPSSRRGSPTISQASGIPVPKTRAPDSRSLHYRKLFDRQAGRTSVCSHASWHGHVPYAESVASKTCSRPAIPQPNLSPIQYDPNASLTDDDVTDCSGLITTRSPSEATIESPQIVPQQECAMESASSGIGTMSSTASSTAMPIHTRQAGGNTQSVVRTSLKPISQSYSANHEQEFNVRTQSGRLSRHHHHHHHHHHHQHAHHYHRYHGPHANHDLYRRHHRPQSSNRICHSKQIASDGRNRCPAQNNTMEDYNFLTTPHGDEQQAVPAPRNVPDSRTQTITQGHYRSSSMVAKRPVYEVSVTSSPDPERAANTPVLSAWSASEDASTHTPVARY